LQYDGFAEINAVVRNNVPSVFGEIASKQFANDDQCYYGIDGTNLTNPPTYVTPSGSLFTYQALLARLAQDEIGWLTWSWWPDSCEGRPMSSDGKFNNLTPYGMDIVNGPYGLKNAQFGAQRAAL
jgi:mannan endo-1,4-beta-mannosidase